MRPDPHIYLESELQLKAHLLYMGFWLFTAMPAAGALSVQLCLCPNHNTEVDEFRSTMSYIGVPEPAHEWRC